MSSAQGGLEDQQRIWHAIRGLVGKQRASPAPLLRIAQYAHAFAGASVHMYICVYWVMY